MDNLKKETQKEDLKSLYEIYLKVISTIEELNSSIKELPEKEEI